MPDSTDRTSGKTGLTLTINACKTGASSHSTITPTVTDLGNGWYDLALTTTHTNTLGEMTFWVTATGAESQPFKIKIVAEESGNLSAGAIQAIWDALTSALTTSGSIGKLLTDNVNATISSRSTLTSANVWDALTSGLTTANSIGKLLVDNVNATISSRSTLTAAAVWDYLTSAAVTVGSFGKLIKDNLNAAVTTRAAAGTYSIDDVYTTTVLGFTTEASTLSGINTTVGAISSNLDTYAGQITSDIAEIPQDVWEKPVADIIGVTGSVGRMVTTELDGLYDVCNSAQGFAENAATQAGEISAAMATATQASDIQTQISSAVGDLMGITLAEYLISLANSVSVLSDGADDATTTLSGLRKTNFQKGIEFSNYIFPMFDNDGELKSGLDVTGKISLDAGAWANCENDITEVGLGFYSITLTSDETDANAIGLIFSAPTAKDLPITEYTVE